MCTGLVRVDKPTKVPVAISNRAHPLSKGSEYRGQHEVFATTSSIPPTSDTVWRRSLSTICGLSELDDEPVRCVLEAGDDDGAAEPVVVEPAVARD